MCHSMTLQLFENHQGKYIIIEQIEHPKNIQKPSKIQNPWSVLPFLKSCCLICPALSKLKLRSASASSRSKSSILCRKSCKVLMASPEFHRPSGKHRFFCDGFSQTFIVQKKREPSSVTINYYSISIYLSQDVIFQ